MARRFATIEGSAERIGNNQSYLQKSEPEILRHFCNQSFLHNCKTAMLTGIVLIGGLAALALSNAIDRKKHPEKWEKIDAENRKKQAQKRAEKEDREHAEAMKRVPPSVWMRMSRDQKADVLLRREKAVEKRASRNDVVE